MLTFLEATLKKKDPQIKLILITHLISPTKSNTSSFQHVCSIRKFEGDGFLFEQSLKPPKVARVPVAGAWTVPI
jgi:hypothetical protein